MSVLDKDHTPTVMYTDVYKSGTVYFQTHQVVATHGNEIPFVRDIHDFLNDESATLRFFDLPIEEYTVEQLIFENLIGTFNSDAMSIQPLVKHPHAGQEMCDQYVVTLVNAKYDNKPVYTALVTLTKKE